jgi:hypothetical protein
MAPPKLATPTDDMVTRHEHAVRLQTKVHGLVHQGNVPGAIRVFDQGWQSTMLHNLPARYPFLLDKVDRRGVRQLITLAKDGIDAPPELRALPGVDPINPERVGVGIQGEDNVLGFLPDDALELLDGAGDLADIYDLRLLAVRPTDKGSHNVEVELVRPDLRQCSACTDLHTGEHENCDSCRSRRRRKNRTLEETAEVPSVPTLQAFEDIREAKFNPDR